MRNSDHCVRHQRNPTSSPAKHGYYATEDTANIDSLIADVWQKHKMLSAYINKQVASGADMAEVLKAFALFGQNASRLGRLLRDKKAITGAADGDSMTALENVLDDILANYDGTE